MILCKRCNVAMRRMLSYEKDKCYQYLICPKCKTIAQKKPITYNKNGDIEYTPFTRKDGFVPRKPRNKGDSD